MRWGYEVKRGERGETTETNHNQPHVRTRSLDIAQPLLPAFYLHIRLDLLSPKTATTMDAFRKIDIDVYDEDVLAESELYSPDPRSPDQVLSDTKGKAASIRGILAK